MHKRNFLNRIELPILASACPIELNNNIALLGGIITKTFTLNKQTGRISDYWNNELNTLNSLGLPNNGISTIDFNKYIYYKVPFIISIKADSLEEYQEIIYFISNHCELQNEYFYGLEINISCPNIKYKDEHKNYIQNVIEIIRNSKLRDFFISIKISPITSIEDIIDLSKLDIDALNCFNTKPIHHYNKSYGLGGKILLEEYLQNISAIKRHIKCDIIGTGGVTSLNAIEKYISLGCKAVGVASYFLINSNNIKEIVFQYAEKFY